MALVVSMLVWLTVSCLLVMCSVVGLLVCDGGYMVWVLQLGCKYVVAVMWSGFCC